MVLLLLVVGALTRIYGAWQARFSTSADAAVVYLMVKHMLAGMGFPIFYYGQGYMGNVEPVVSYLFALVLGISRFAVNLGTALLGFLTLPIVYCWARDVGGRVVGIASLAFCVIGPAIFYYFQFVPRGGYMSILLIGTTILWYSCRSICRELETRRMRVRDFLLLGLLAGLGWWSDPLVTPAILTAGLLFLIYRRLDAFRLRRIGPAVLGFMTGSLPYWVWNYRRGWNPFGFARTIIFANFKQGLHVLLRDRFPAFLDLTGRPGWIVAVLSLIYGGALVLSFLALCARGVRTRKTGVLAYVLAALLFVVLFGVVFSVTTFSRMNTPRYLIPLVPVIAIVIGIATDVLVHRWRILGWVPLLVLMALQVRSVANLRPTAHDEKIEQENAQTLGRFLREQRVDAVYVWEGHYGLNYSLNEEIPFVCLEHERQRNYADRAERSEHPAVLNEQGDVSGFLEASGGRAEMAHVGGYVVRYRFEAPPDGLEEISTGLVSSITDALGQNVTTSLSDDNIDSRWQTRFLSSREEWLEVRFKKPVEVSAIRFLSTDELDSPPTYRVLARAADDAPWLPLTPVMASTLYYWSGPRPYFSGSDYRFEIRFAPYKAKSLKLVFPADVGQDNVGFDQIRFFGPAARAESYSFSITNLFRLIKDRHVGRVYSGRWVANHVHAQFGDAVKLQLESSIYWDGQMEAATNVIWDPDVALVVDGEQAMDTRICLAERGVAMRETPIGPWVVFDFGPGQWRAEHRDSGLVWTPFGVLKGNGKRQAVVLAQRAAILAGAGKNDDARKLLDRALDMDPRSQFALHVLVATPGLVTNAVEMSRLRADLDTLTRPQVPAGVRFGKGIELLGVSLDPATVRPGGHLRARYYWRCPPDADAQSLAVFVHFEDGDRRFQDDHICLLSFRSADLSFQPGDEVFVEDRIVEVPPGTGKGTYKMSIGLVRPDTGYRLKPQTSLPTERKAVLLPVSVRVGG